MIHEKLLSNMELFWIWLILGFALLAAELLSGTFVILFFGIGALLTSAVAIFTPAPLALQILIFSLASLALMLIFRRRFITPVTAAEKKSLLSADVDTQITLSETLPAQGEAMISYQRNALDRRQS